MSKENMTLKTTARIQMIVTAALILLALPFGVIGMLIGYLQKPFEWIIEGRDWLIFFIGNRLMRHSKEFKDGVIRNEYCIKYYTAANAYDKLKEENKAKED